MGIPVLILGETGSGKTYSIKNFDVNEVGIFSVEKGRLPFRDKGFKIVKNATYAHIMRTFQDPKLKKYVIDDSQYLLVHELFNRVNETGYKKYTDMAVNFRNLIYMINHQLPEDVIVYFLHHVETNKETGKAKAKTVGQMIDQYLTLEGCFDIVLYAGVDSNGHYFVTQSDGTNTAKSPEEMFEVKINNDLKFVDETIRDYWNLKGAENND